MKLHERHEPTTRAKLAVMDAVGKAVEAYSLTYAELWALLCEVGASWSKGAIREERNSEGPR